MVLIFLCVSACIFCGCERSIETDPVLFCRTFNERSGSLQLSEENAFRCSDTEYLLYAGNILLRVQTDESQCIHTVIVSSDGKQTETLRDAANTAFGVLSEPFAELPPTDFLSKIQTGDTDIIQTDTEHFIYLLYRSPETVTVQQINRHLRALPSLPELHSEGTPPSSSAHASQSH